MKFVKLMATPGGRILRFLLGAGIFLAGVRISGIGGYAIALVGLLPMFAGAADMCLLAPIFGYPMTGKQIREG